MPTPVLVAVNSRKQNRTVTSLSMDEHRDSPSRMLVSQSTSLVQNSSDYSLQSILSALKAQMVTLGHEMPPIADILEDLEEISSFAYQKQAHANIRQGISGGSNEFIERSKFLDGHNHPAFLDVKQYWEFCKQGTSEMGIDEKVMVLQSFSSLASIKFLHFAEIDPAKTFLQNLRAFDENSEAVTRSSAGYDVFRENMLIAFAAVEATIHLKPNMQFDKKLTAMRTTAKGCETLLSELSAIDAILPR